MEDRLDVGGPTQVSKKEERVLGLEARLRLPDVDEALDLGHSIHGADDPDLKDTYDQQLARQLAQGFLALEGDEGTLEAPYLRAMKLIARGYGRSLTRAKDIWRKELKEALEERTRQEYRLRGGRLSTQGIVALSKYLLPVILGIAGFLLAQLLGLNNLSGVSDETGTNLLSIAASLGGVLLWRLGSKWWYDRRTDKIVEGYKIRKDLADQKYELTKLLQFKHWRQKGCVAWRQYTGEDFPERSSYQTVMQGDMNTRRQMQDRLTRHEKSDAERVQEVFNYFWGKLRRKKNTDSTVAVE